MRLLKATTRQLKEFVAEEEIPPYAVLSHTWGKAEDEVTLHDLTDSSVVVKPGYLKIDYCCKQASKDGLQWVWIDTCCIDKSSTAELSEAINSMFRWYQNAKVCYTYLNNVQFQRNADTPSFVSQFERSRWFTRGWTLQELIAPQALIFFDRDWVVLGTKKDMASSSDTLASITRIDERFLLSTDRFWHLRDDGPCIAQIMSWAADRKTTRIEDKAYCLLGLFDINMPLLYGEGKKAFFRLQEELIKCSNDPSIFAWGISPAVQELSPHARMSLNFQCNWQFGQGGVSTTGMLARSPENFRHCGNIRRRNLGMASSGTLRSPTATINRGIRIEMCCFTLQEVLTDVAELMIVDPGFVLPKAQIEMLETHGPVFGLIPCTIEGDDINLILIPLLALDESTSTRRAGYQLFGRSKTKPLIFVHYKVLKSRDLSSQKILQIDSHWISD